MSDFSIGIMGTGSMASIMAHTIKKIKGIKCVAVSSENECRAAKFSKKHGIKNHYSTYNSMIDSVHLDLVYIATLNCDHRRCAEICINKGVPFLLEKPFCIKYEDVNAIVGLAKDKNVFIAEAMLHLYSSILGEACKLVREEKLGKPVLFVASLGIPMPNLERVRKVELGGGAALDLGCYIITLSNLILGEQESFIRYSRISDDGMVDVSNEYVISYQNGAQAILIDSIDTKYDNEGILYCENGYIRIYDTYNISTIEVKGELKKKVFLRKGNGYREEIISVVELIKKNSGYINNMSETLTTSRCLDVEVSKKKI